MKLLFDCTELSYFNENSGHRAGVFYVALNLLKEFQKLGIDITFHCDYRRYYFMKDIEEFRDIPLIKENSIVNKFIAKIFYLTRNFPLKFQYALVILGRFYDRYFYKINKRNLEQLKDFDIYFSPYTPPSTEISVADLKRFRMIHDTIPIVEGGMPKSAKDWYYKIYNSINDKDFYVVNSEFTKLDVLKYFPFIKEENIKTTLLGANEEFYQDKKNIVGKNYIFSLCTLGKRKNIIFGIENFFKFIKDNNIDDLSLVLGGGVWKKFEKELNSVIDKYDKSKIIMTGYIKGEELRNYYSDALCFIYPSLYEGFGLPVLEAMQCGCPVITSNRSSLPEVIGDCGIIVDPCNDEQMQEAYKKMYYDESFRQECSVQGIKRAKTFSWEKCAKEIIEFIGEKL